MLLIGYVVRFSEHRTTPFLNNKSYINNYSQVLDIHVHNFKIPEPKV